MTRAVDSLWDTARKLGRPKPRGKPLPPLLFFTDPVRTPFPQRVIAQLPRGAAVVYRAFGAPDALETGRRLARLSRGRGVLFVIGADAALAVGARAAGVHLPQRLAGRAGDIRRLRRRFLVTAAAHDLPAGLRAQRSGVQAVVVSPVFPSLSPSAGAPLGARRLAMIARALDIPVYALGGVNARTARALARAGAYGLAAIDGLTIASARARATDPPERART